MVKYQISTSAWYILKLIRYEGFIYKKKGEYYVFYLENGWGKTTKVKEELVNRMLKLGLLKKASGILYPTESAFDLVDNYYVSGYFLYSKKNKGDKNANSKSEKR